MSRLLTGVLIVMGGALLGAGAGVLLNGSSNGPNLTLSVKDLLLGDIQLGGSRQGAIKVKNLGRVPRHILGIEVGCGCTRADVESRTILPGQATTLKVTITGTNLTEDGRQILCVQTDDPNHPRLELAVQYRVRAKSISFQPARVDFGRIRRPAIPIEMRCTAHYPPGKDRPLTLNSRLPPFVEVTWPAQDIVAVALLPTVPCGQFVQKLEWTSDGVLVSLPVTAYVRGPIYADPPHVYVSSAAHTSRESAAKTAILSRESWRIAAVGSLVLSENLANRLHATAENKDGVAWLGLHASDGIAEIQSGRLDGVLYATVQLDDGRTDQLSIPVFFESE